MSLQIASASAVNRDESTNVRIDMLQATLPSTVTSTNCGTWNTVSNLITGTLYGLSTQADNEVWAVGTQYGALNRPLIEHWDGAQWNTVTSSANGILQSVAAVSTDDVWAVGESGGYTNLILHWDGTQWNSVTSPYRNWQFSHLYSVDARTANDVWAVGYTCTCDGFEDTRNSLVMHWDGTTWSMITSPKGAFHGVAIGGADDLWAVGWTCVSNFLCDFQSWKEALVAHWNGTMWSTMPGPMIGSSSELLGISALAPNDIWAVGDYRDVGSGPDKTLTVHWDGTGWATVPSPNMESRLSRLFGVVAITANDVWTAGRTSSEASADYQTLTMHWDGSEWVVVPSDDPGSEATLYAVSAATSNNVWAAGDYLEGEINRALIERFTFPLFSDVPVSNTFYAPVQCLVCKGIISGYADGTFRPNNEVTRGQLSKIVSNSAGFNEDRGEQRFEDVPPSNTFYVWVQRLASRGYISGYECGGPGEPCVSGKPYFRPNANATRGQISKIVANAVQYNDPPGTQIFEDVPTSHTFYEWIQRLASRGIMSGYPCGGPGEPCISGKPYFRPQNNATRGQTSKIVANTFFPECQTP